MEGRLINEKAATTGAEVSRIPPLEAPGRSEEDTRPLVACIGDSITKGRIWETGGRPKITRNSFPNLLERVFEKVRFVNAGVTNNTSYDVLTRLGTDVLTKKPAYVIVEVGGNDCNFDWAQVAAKPDETHAATVSIVEFRRNLGEIVARVRAVGATPILSTLPPLDAERYYAFLRRLYSDLIAKWICLNGGIFHWQERYSRAVAEVARELGTTLADVRARFLEMSDYRKLMSEDGLHPNEKGHLLMTTEYARVLAALGL